MKASSWLLGLVAAVLAAQHSAPAGAADANNGGRLAARWCASCHLIDPTQPQTTTEAPPFSAIARKPDFDTGALALFLLHPHPKMPDFGLSRDTAADLAAFIASQR